MEKEEQGKLTLFQPEILSKEALIELIKERCPTIGELRSFEHDALVELFYKNVAPHPQRKYRANRRGQKMTKNQILREKRKRPHDQISGSAEKRSPPISQPSSGLINSFNIKAASDRLKPPPSAINFERKVVKLGKSPPASANHSDSSTTTKIKLSSGTTTKASVISINKPLDKSSISNTSNVINIKHHNGSSSSDSAEKDPASSTAGGITKILPEKKACSKIKLKRMSDINIETAMDVNSQSEKQGECGKTVSNGMVNSETKSSPVSRKISLSSKPKSDNDSNSSQEQQKDNPIEVVQKKFKRAVITWP